MFKFNLSVRAYHHARRYGLPSYELWTAIPAEDMRGCCFRAAESVRINHRGKMTAIELYRAAGLGVHAIAHLMSAEGVSLDRVRSQCEWYDKQLHESLV